METLCGAFTYSNIYYFRVSPLLPIWEYVILGELRALIQRYAIGGTDIGHEKYSTDLYIGYRSTVGITNSGSGLFCALD